MIVLATRLELRPTKYEPFHIAQEGGAKVLQRQNVIFSEAKQNSPRGEAKMVRRWNKDG